MQLTDEDLFAMMSQISLSMLGFELSVLSVDPGRLEMAATVDITDDGEPVADVVVECGNDLARTLAMAMFAIPEREVSADDVRDALGELANIVGGNVKGVLAMSTVLSLPVVTTGDAIDTDTDATECQTVSFKLGPHHLRISVRHRQLAS